MTNRWRLFCEGSSIRGVQKILRAKSAFIKVLWTAFVIVMTLVLLTVSAFLVRDFLNYDTAWHTSTAFDEKPEFPAFTLCSHNPFSHAAQAAWQSGAAMSPLQFQQMLKRHAAAAANSNLSYVGTLFAYDNIETYYQQLSFNDTTVIGHGADSLFFCVVVAGGHQYIAENCQFQQLLAVRVRLFSHSEFFNCFTVEMLDSSEFESFIVVMSLVPAQNLTLLRHSFLYDVLTRGEGVKVTIHEKGAIPDFAQSGFNVEPGRMNEVNYATTGWRKLRTPKEECRDNQEKIRHLNVTYTASYHQCVNAQLQRHLLRSCGCMSSLWPVVRVPTARTPYCIDVSRDAANLSGADARLECVMHVLLQMEQLRKNLSSLCWPRCTYYTYESKLSITKWIPSPSKLEALVEQSTSRDAFDYNRISKEQYLEVISKNISQHTSQMYTRRLSQQNSYTYIKIKRKNWDTTWMVEKLTLDVNILLSRIGGLCSLCIGLTAAFVVEMIEFVYLSLRQPEQDRQKDQTDQQQQQQQQQQQHQQQCRLLPAADPWEKSECAVPLADGRDTSRL